MISPPTQLQASLETKLPKPYMPGKSMATILVTRLGSRLMQKFNAARAVQDQDPIVFIAPRIYRVLIKTLSDQEEHLNLSIHFPRE